MSADQDYLRHLEIYRGFTKFLTWGSACAVAAIVILALVTL
jgi:hypothetical protein